MRQKKQGKVLKFFLGIVVISVLAGLVWWYWALQPYAASGQTMMLSVKEGATAGQIAAELEQRQIIRSALAFNYLVRTQKADAKLLPGEYYLSAAMSPNQIIQVLLKGPDIDTVRVTIPEGFRTEQIIDLLVKKGLGSKESFTKVITGDSFPYAFIQGTPAGMHRLEGFLFPDTYFFKRWTSPHQIIDTLLKRFNRELTPEVLADLQKSKLSIHDWVTLASIVEKEAVKETDRPLIASVYFNRLKKGMKLEADPTVQFILGITPKPMLYDKDLQTPSPYNTYLHPGLPPGPIANPGHASLDAVLHPAQTDYLFFVAKSDGYHVFAQTFSEHLQNQKKYQ